MATASKTAQEYRVSHLANILGISEVALRKKVNRGDFKTTAGKINNRLVTLILLEDNELQELKNKTEVNKNVYSAVSKDDKHSKTFAGAADFASETLMKFMDKHTEELQLVTTNFATKLEELKNQNTALAQENVQLKIKLNDTIGKYNQLVRKIKQSN